MKTSPDGVQYIVSRPCAQVAAFLFLLPLQVMNPAFHNNISIRKASAEDASLIALVLAMAMGGDESHPLFDIFCRMAQREDSQYSWRNTFVAEIDGTAAGAIVGYDGARLYELRRPLEEAIRDINGGVFNIEDETSAGEFYIDSLAILPLYRGMGIAKSLMEYVRERVFAEGFDKVGLIVDYGNPRAEGLYESIGFKRVNPTTFLGHDMWHMQANRDIPLLIGGYGERIHKAIFNSCSGKIEIVQSLDAKNASYVIGEGDSIYTFSESGPDSKIYSFNGGQRKEILCSGDDPCFITLSPDGKYILTADYSGGSVSLYPIRGGEVAEMAQKIHFKGSGPLTRRQASSHIYQVRFLPQIEGIEGDWVLAPDLGADKVRVLGYFANAINGQILTHFTDIPLPAGSGPRHLDFDSGRGMMYCLSELSGELFVFKVSADAGGDPVFELVQTVLADECRSGGSGDIHIHPSGKYLYTSHRLQNDGLAVFEIAEDGRVRKKGYVHTQKHPRNFLITPDGRHILVASKNEFSVQVFVIDSEGIPVPTDHIFNLSPDAPTCITIL